LQLADQRQADLLRAVSSEAPIADLGRAGEERLRVSTELARLGLAHRGLQLAGETMELVARHEKERDEAMAKLEEVVARLQAVAEMKGAEDGAKDNVQ
jgi:hypothetical protein